MKNPESQGRSLETRSTQARHPPRRAQPHSLHPTSFTFSLCQHTSLLLGDLSPGKELQHPQTRQTTPQRSRLCDKPRVTPNQPRAMSIQGPCTYLARRKDSFFLKEETWWWQACFTAVLQDTVWGRRFCTMLGSGRSPPHGHKDLAGWGLALGPQLLQLLQLSTWTLYPSSPRPEVPHRTQAGGGPGLGGPQAPT